MNPSWTTSWFTASIALVCTLVACAPTPSGGSDAAPAGDQKDGEGEKAAKGLPDRDPELAHKLVDEQGALLLDVRSQSEFDGGHADGAKLIPHGEVPDRIAEIEQMVGGDKDKPIVLYCRSGHRAGIAKKALVDAGFTQVTNVGGLRDYEK